MAFKIVPRLAYEATREYQQTKKQFDAMQNTKPITDGHHYEKGLSRTESFHDRAALMRNLQVLRIRMIQEQEFNNRLIKIRQGDSVLYGNEIQLQHLDSGAFLQISKQTADYDKECQKLELTQNPNSSRVVFEIYPRYKYRQPGDRIIYEDQILIYNSKTHTYLHYSSEMELPQEENTDIPSNYRPKSPYRRLNPEALYTRFEVNISSIYKKWQILPYRVRTQIKESGFIHGGDVIRLKHAESGGYICVDDELVCSRGERKAYVRIYNGDDEFDQVTSNSLFEIELDMQQQSEPGAIASWKDGQKVPNSSKFRFRHLNSGRVLQIKTTLINNKPLHYLVLGKIYPNQGEDNQQEFIKLEDQVDEEAIDQLITNTYFTFESSGHETEEGIQTDSVVKIKSADNGFFLNSVKKKSETDDDNQEDGGEMQDSEDEEDDVVVDDEYLERNSLEEEMSQIVNESQIDAKIFTQMNKEEFNNVVIQKVFLKKISREDDVFLLKKPHHKEISDVLFIHSCVPMIKQFITSIRRRQIEKFSLAYFSSFEKVLENLIFFITETENKDPFTCEGIPFKDRQKYMRETRVIDLIIDILHYPFHEKIYSIQDLTQRHPITRICKLIYRLLKHTVKDNIMNKFYVAQYIELFFNQAMTTTEQNNFQAESTITELLKNNKILLDKQITKETIQNFVDLCKLQKKNERFLNLLSTLCSCNGDAVASNQDDTCEILLQIEENRESLILKMITVDGSHEIVIKEPEVDQKTLWIKVEDLYEISLKRDELRIFNYFKSLINLSAEICLQRNYKGILLLEKMYNQKQVLHCALSGSIPLKLRAKFAKLLLHLHIDKDPMEIITVPVLTRVWQEISQSKTQLPKSKVKISDELLLLKPFVAKFFNQQNGIMRAYEIDFNQYCMEILGIVKGMMKLGFYENEEELIQMIDPLITLLDGSLDFITKEEEQIFRAQSQDPDTVTKMMPDGDDGKGKRYKTNETNLLLMLIKDQIINILQKVLDLQNDIRLTQFLIEFNRHQLPDTPEQINFINKVLKGKHKDERYYKDEKFMAIKEQNDQLVIKWMNHVFEDKTLDLERISARDFVCILLDLILYENSDLVNSAFKLLVKFFTQKKAIIDLVSEVQLLEDDQEIAILKTVSLQLTDMKKDAENAEFWLGYSSQEALIKSRNIIDKFEMLTDLCLKKAERVYDFADITKLNLSIQKHDPPQKSTRGISSRRPSKVSHQANTVNLLTVANNDSQNSSQLRDLNLSEIVSEWEDDDLKVISDDEINEASNQRLLRNLRAHEVALILIKHQDLPNAENQNSYLHVLEKCYIFLIKFVRNNRENQQILMPHIDLFLQDIEFGVHAIELISEIFKDNESLLEYNIAPIIKRICQLVDEQQIESPKKATLISFLSYFMKCNNLIIKENQILILNEMTNSSRKNTFYLFSGQEGLETFELYLQEMKQYYGQFMLDPKLVPEIFIPNELQYTIEFINELSSCGEGKNLMTEVKCQGLYSVKEIAGNLRIAEFCYPYKAALSNFFLHIYISTEKDQGEENFGYIWQIIEVFLEDITRFVETMTRHSKNKIRNIENERRGASMKKSLVGPEIEKLTTVDINRNFKMQNCFGSVQIIDLYQKYIYESIIPCLTDFFELRYKMNDAQTLIVKKIIKNFTKLSHFARNKSHVRNIHQIFKTLWKIPLLKELSEGVQNQARGSSDKKKEEAKKGSGSKEDVNTAQKLNNAQKLRAMMISAQDSPELIESFEKEFQQLILSIIYIKKKSEIGFEGINTLEPKYILKSLISITDINSSIEKDLRKTSLKILRKVVELENKELTTPAAEWELENWQKFEYQIKERQNMLTGLKIVKLICRIISFETIRSIKEEALLVAIAILLGGNFQSQQKFFKYIQKDLENVFAEKINEMMIQCFEVIKKSEIRRNGLMLKLYQLQKKIDEMKEILDSDGNEIKKLEQQLSIVQDEIKEFEQVSQSAKDSETLTPQRAIYQLRILFRFLQLLCENHNINLQNSLREQLNIEGSPNGKTYDLVTQMAKIFGQYSRVFNQITCELGYQIVDCLIEFVQGPCHMNQKALIIAKIIDSSRDYIAGFDKPIEYVPLGFTDEEEDQEQISLFKKKIVTLLLSLLEGEADMDIITRMSLSLDFQVMKERMLIVFASFAQKILGQDFTDIASLSLSQLDSRLDKNSFEGNVSEAFEIFTLFHNLAENVESAKNNIDRKKFTPDEWKAYEFVRSHTGRIEVAVNNNLQRVYFPIIPVCHYISKESRKSLMVSVNRESQASKVNGLLNQCPDLIDEMIHNESLNRAKIKITPQRLAGLKDLSTFLAVLVNAILIIFLERENQYREVYEPDFVINMIYYMGIVQGACSSILIFFYAITRGRLITNMRWREYIKKNKGQMKPFENEERLYVTEMSIEMTQLILLTKGPEASEFNLGKSRVFGNAFTRFQYYMFNCYFFFQDLTFQYYLLYFMISMLGFFYLDIFYAFHLLDFISRFPVLQNVIKSVTLNKNQLIMTGVLQMTIIFIYSTIGFFYLQDTFIDINANKYDSDNIGENMCSTMLQCFITCINLGLRNGGGIRDSTLPIALFYKEKYIIKFIYDCTFHLTIIVVMLNILFGIIIDTFAQLRDTKKQMDEDMKNICYICSLDRYTFDKYSDGFERHIERDHNLWQYVNYIVQLQMKDPTEYTGIESYVFEKYEQGDISWVPLMKALCLKGKID